MPISGTQPALTEARIGMMRVGGSRVGYVLPIPHATINGVNRTNDVRIEGASIRDVLNGTPNTATMRVDGFTPTEGHEVVLNFGTHGPTQFRGRILSTTKIYETDNPANVAWDCSCISEEWLLNNRKVTKRYLSTSATEIILDIIATYAPGFSSAGVVSGLPSLDEITFTNEDVTDCLDRICQRIGEDWQLDYAKVLHVPAADGLSANAITDSDDHGMSGIAVTTDLSQLKTRQSGEGGGSNASVDVAVGQATMPVDNGNWYNPAGGVVKSGPQFITYTGKSAVAGTGTTVAGTPLSPGTLTAAMVAGTSGNLSPGAYQYKTAFVTPLGESEVSGASSAVSVTSLATPGALTAAVASGTSGNLSVGSYPYKVTFVTADGETAAGAASSAATIAHVSAPSTPSGSVVSETSGNLGVGVFRLTCTYVTAAGNTLPSAASSNVTIAAVSAPSAPSGSMVANTPGNLRPGSYGYKLTNDTVAGKTTLSGSGSVTVTDVSAPSIGSAAATGTTGGTLTPSQAYAWYVTFFTAVGETTISGSFSATLGGSDTAAALTNLPTSSDGRVIGRRIYREIPPGGSTNIQLVGEIHDNVKTTWTDTVGDAEVGGGDPSTSTAGSGQTTITIATSGDGRVTTRTLWRTARDGSAYFKLATIGDNTTTTFVDNIPDTSLGDAAPTTNTAGSGQITWTVPTSSDGRVTKVNLWRTELGGSLHRFLTALTNGTTTFVDNRADTSLGAEAPTVNTSGSGQLSLTGIPTSADGRVTKRRVYRPEADGSVYKLAFTIPDNTTTTFTDNTRDSSLGVEAPTTDTASSGQISLTVIPLGPPGTTARTLSRTEANGTVYKALATIAGNVTTTYTDNIADTRLGEHAPTVSRVGAAAGATTLRVSDTAVVEAAGGWAHVDSQLIRFTGRSVASGEGLLTGIPASGTGSIAAGLAAGSAVINAPHLTGVTGIVYAIPQGEAVNIWVTRNDTAAQAFMAAALTTATYTHDGIIEADPIQDRRMSETEITARCDAKLEELTPPLVNVRYQTRDITTKSGRTVPVTLSAPTSISGTFKIQSVTTTGFSANGEHLPERMVECSSRLLTFEQVLRIRKAT